MNGVETLVESHFWWVTYFVVGIGILAVIKAADHGWIALSMWLDRNKPISDPMIAEFIQQMKDRGERPPPHAIYFACWLVAGIVSLVAGHQLLQ